PPPTVAPAWEPPAGESAPAAPSWGAPSAAPVWEPPRTEEPAAPPAPSWGAPAASAAPEAPPATPAPPPWNSPAPAWSAAAAAESAAPASTDAELAAGAEAAQASPVEPASAEPPGAPWQAPRVAADMDVAETMVARPPIDTGGAEREPTTLMPAWQPPPPAPPALPETVAMPARSAQAGAAAVGAGPQGELTIETGPDAGHKHRAGDHALRLGRSPDNDVILRDPATSGHHARLERRGDQFWLV